jgi:dTMP kinase
MAAAEPHRYIVVDADGSADEVADRVFGGLRAVLPGPPTSAGDPAEVVP